MVEKIEETELENVCKPKPNNSNTNICNWSGFRSTKTPVMSKTVPGSKLVFDCNWISDLGWLSLT